jgi:hypothetical protein
MPKCKKCAAAIRFIKMQSGKYMPVDPDKKPYREGGSEIFITDDGKMIRGHSPFGPEPVNGYAYTPHWATCPDAAEFRRE